MREKTPFLSNTKVDPNLLFWGFRDFDMKIGITFHCTTEQATKAAEEPYGTDFPVVISTILNSADRELSEEGDELLLSDVYYYKTDEQSAMVLVANNSLETYYFLIHRVGKLKLEDLSVIALKENWVQDEDGYGKDKITSVWNISGGTELIRIEDPESSEDIQIFKEIAPLTGFDTSQLDFNYTTDV
jgi:hypothetical protein